MTAVSAHEEELSTT